MIHETDEYKFIVLREIKENLELYTILELDKKEPDQWSSRSWWSRASVMRHIAYNHPKVKLDDVTVVDTAPHIRIKERTQGRIQGWTDTGK